ncbi:MAG: hypothetical protein ACFFCW_00445 [Candidatus Hodarchaeota archaeon]
MVRYIIITLLLCVNLCGCFSDWKPHQKILAVTYTTANIIDILQTKEIKRDNNGFKECNPVLDSLSRDEATAVQIGMNLAILGIADYFPKIRTPLLIGGNALSWGCVINNHQIGVRIGGKF